MRGRIAFLVVIMALGSNGCGPRKKLVLPAPRPAVAQPLPEATIETPPEIETPVPIVEIPLPEMKVEPPPPTTPPKKPAVPVPAAQTTPPEVQPSAPAVPPAPTPRLGEILTDDRRREYQAEFTGFVTGARAAVNRTNGRQLTAAQQETVARIRVFLQQAEEQRDKDLATALQLARRADLLGKDLVNSLR